MIQSCETETSSRDICMEADCKHCNPILKGSLLLEPCTCTNKKTLGAEAVDLMSKGDQKQGVIDTQREMTKGYISQLITCARRGEQALGRQKPFYICVETRRERLLQNVIRNQFYYRITRPSPTYDLALYWYDPKDEQLRFVWCIPDKEKVQRITGYWAVVEEGGGHFKKEWIPGEPCPPGEEQLYTFVTLFVNSSLV